MKSSLPEPLELGWIRQKATSLIHLQWHFHVNSEVIPTVFNWAHSQRSAHRSAYPMSYNAIRSFSSLLWLLLIHTPEKRQFCAHYVPRGISVLGLSPKIFTKSVLQPLGELFQWSQKSSATGHFPKSESLKIHLIKC